MLRQPQSRPRKLTDTVEKHVAPGLRARLETSRLKILSFLRALDSLHLAQDLPDKLQTIFELDADLAEALAVLDHPIDKYDLPSMVHDTLASLDRLPRAQKEFFNILHPSDCKRLATRIPVVRAMLDPAEAYNQIPGRDPLCR